MKTKMKDLMKNNNMQSNKIWLITVQLIVLSLFLVLSQLTLAKDRIQYHVQNFDGSTLKVINEQGVVSQSYQYAPFGQQLQYKKPSNLKNPNAFVGGVQDADDLVYLKQRHYNPVLGRFYQPDPVTFLEKGHGQTNRYQYGWNDSYSFKDPNGTEAMTFKGETKFQTEFTDLLSFNVPSTLAGFSYFKDNPNYHIYNRSVYVEGLNSIEINKLRLYIIMHPTPSPKAQSATYSGVFNLANPATTWRSYLAETKTFIHQMPDNVYSVLRSGDSGFPWVVNITRPGHSLYPGIVIRGVQDLGGGKVIIHNYGEGVGNLQSFGPLSNGLVNNIWFGETEKALHYATGRSYKVN